MRLLSIALMGTMIACGQGLVIPLPPPITQPVVVVNEYVEAFPSTNFTTATVVPTAHPIKTGTVVWVYLEGILSPVAAIKKTSAPLTLTLDSTQAGANIKAVVVYKSDE